MPFCKHCSTEITLNAEPGSQPTCPSCGKPIDLSDEDSAKLEASSTDGEPDFTLAINDQSDEHDESDRPDESDGPSTHQEMEYEADATIAFGGQGDDDLIALGGDEDEPDISGPEVTQALVSGGDLSGDESDPSDLTGEPQDTLPVSGDSGHPRPEEQTLAFDPMGSGEAGSDAPDSGSGGSGSGGSDRSSDYSREESGTLDYNTDPRSDLVGAPDPRSLSGADSGQTIPQGLLADDHPSQSLKPEGALFVEHEKVRLRTQIVAHEAPDDQAVYEIVGERHAGGMGEVYRTVQCSMNRSIALKRPKQGMKASDNERSGIISEAVITGQLEHPNIIPVHDVGYGMDGVPFYSMKWVEGEEWETALKEKRLTEDENIDILIKVSQAIAYAHSKNIIHRDLKPANIWLGNFGEVLVMDWGLAARLDGESEILPSGTPSYMPPETALAFLDLYKIRLTKERRVPPGTYGDIYLLGALLFRIVAGRAPHRRGKKNIDCLKNAARNRIARTKKKGELLSIAYKAMATDPGDRHRDVGEFIAELKAFQSHSQSIQIARKASKELRTATESIESSEADTKDVYRGLSRAQHGYENALDLWKGNRHARRRLEQTRRLYAEAAFAGGDYDLALTHLDPEKEADTQLIKDVRSNQSQRSRRLRLYKSLQYGIAASLLAALTFIGISVKLGRDAFSAQNALSVASEKLTKADNELLLADGRIEEANQKAELAEVEAGKKVKEAEDKAQIRIDQADSEALVQIENAQQEATEKVDAVQKEADATITLARAAEQAARSDQQEAVREAKLQGFFVQLGRVRTALLERGAYSAWLELRQLDRTSTAAKDASNEIAYLTEQTDWQSEAAEVRAASDSPARVALSGGGFVGIVSSEPAAVSVYRSEDLENPAWNAPLPRAPQRIAISPNGGSAAAVCDGKLILSTRAGSAELPSAVGEVTSLAFSPDGANLLVGDSGTGVSVWDATLPTSPRLIERNDSLHRNPVVAVGYSPDGEFRFTADKAGTIRVYAGQRSWPYSHAAATYSGIELTAAAMSRDGALVYGDSNGIVYLVRGPWAGTEQEGVEEAGAEFVSLADTDPGLEFIEEKPSKVLALNYGERVASVAFPYREGIGSFIVAAGGNRIAVSAGREIEANRSYHAEAITSCVVPPIDAEYGYSADEQGRAVRWKVDVKPRTQELTPAAEDPKAPVTSVFLAPDTHTLIAADQQGFVRRWKDSHRPDKLERLYNGHAVHRNSNAWYLELPEPTVVTVAADNRACVWDARTGLLKRSVELGNRSVVGLASSGDRLIAATARYGIAEDASGNRLPYEDYGAVAFSLTGDQPAPLWDTRPRVSAICSFQRPGWPPTLAVGLRDGQVYLWRQQQGRVELVASSRRPLFRPVTALLYDPVQDSVFAGDSLGVVAEFRLNDQGLTSMRTGQLPQPGAVRSIQSSSSGRLLIVQANTAGVQVTQCPVDELEQLKANHEAEQARYDQLGAAAQRSFRWAYAVSRGFAPEGQQGELTDATLTASGNAVIALAGQRLFRKPLDGGAWVYLPSTNALTESLSAGDTITRVRCLPNGKVLLHGPGVARMLSGLDSDAVVDFRVRSRAPVGLVTATDAESGLAALTVQGRLIAWQGEQATGGRRSEQALLTRPGGAVVSCAGPEPGQAYVARRDASGNGIAVELLNLTNSQVLREVCNIEQGTLLTLCAEGGWVAAAVQRPGGAWVEVYSPTGQPSRVAVAARGRETPIRLAVGAQGTKLAMVTHSDSGFSAYYAERGENGAWGPLRFVREDASCVAFTPDGARLVVGGLQGQVWLLRIEATPDGVRTHNMLTLTGHTDRVSVVRFAGKGDSLTLVSGDASGRVLLNLF